MQDKLAGGFPVKEYTISDELLTKGFRTGGGPCHCSSTCCEGGVSVDLHERDRILAHHALIRKQMDASQPADARLWFRSEVTDDPDFPSGKCVETSVLNDKCSFLRDDGRCSIQVASVEAGMHRWELKPLFCILFPIEISRGVVGFDAMLQNEMSCCSIGKEFAVPLFEGVKDELVHLLGDDGYREIEGRFRAGGGV